MKIIGGILFFLFLVIFVFFRLSRLAAFDDRQKIEIIDNQNKPVIEFDCEIADRPIKRARGLMFREKIDEDKGMFFIFPDVKNRSFWMKNTFIPLDIIFINQNKKIVGYIENAQPETTQPLTVDKPSKYVLEINSGLVEKYGIKKGYKVIINNK